MICRLHSVQAAEFIHVLRSVSEMAQSVDGLI